MNAAYLYLAIAICSEVVATVSMKAVKGWSTPLPLALVIIGYSIAFWMLTLVVRTVPVGVAYAVWAGMGIVMVSIAALFIYGQKLDVPAMLGMGLIVLGGGGHSTVLENRRALTATQQPVYCASCLEH